MVIEYDHVSRTTYFQVLIDEWLRKKKIYVVIHVGMIH